MYSNQYLNNIINSNQGLHFVPMSIEFILLVIGIFALIGILFFRKYFKRLKNRKEVWGLIAVLSLFIIGLGSLLFNQFEPAFSHHDEKTIEVARYDLKVNHHLHAIKKASQGISNDQSSKDTVQGISKLERNLYLEQHPYYQIKSPYYEKNVK